MLFPTTSRRRVHMVASEESLFLWAMRPLQLRFWKMSVVRSMTLTWRSRLTRDSY